MKNKRKILKGIILIIILSIFFIIAINFNVNAINSRTSSNNNVNNANTSKSDFEIYAAHQKIKIALIFLSSGTLLISLPIFIFSKNKLTKLEKEIAKNPENGDYDIAKKMKEILENEEIVYGIPINYNKSRQLAKLEKEIIEKQMNDRFSQEIRDIIEKKNKVNKKIAIIGFIYILCYLISNMI